LTKFKRGLKALFKGTRSQRNSKATTASQVKRQSEAIDFRQTDLTPLVNADDTLVQTSYVSDLGLPVGSSSPTARPPQIPPQHRHSTALILERPHSSDRVSPVSEISRSTSPVPHAPSPIDEATAHTGVPGGSLDADARTELHKIAATPIIAKKSSLQHLAEEGGSEDAHETWKDGEDETLFVADTNPDVIGQATPPSVTKMDTIAESHEVAPMTDSKATTNADSQEPTAELTDSAAQRTTDQFSDEKEIINHDSPLTREVSAGILPAMLATSGPLQDFYYVEIDEQKERYPGRLAC